MRAFILLSLLLPLSASAYLPPSFFLYSEVASHRGKGTMMGATLTVSRPLPTGGEEVIGSITLPGSVAGASAWPSLSLLLQNEEAALVEAVRGFGLPVVKEADLLRASRDQAAAMKEPPRPFYKTDPLMSMKRFSKTYAWVHADKEGSRAIWVEKDTFLPLRIEGPCPVELSWAKAGENRCAMEFRNVYALRRGNATGARIVLMKDGFPAVYFSFDKLTPVAVGGSVTISPDAKLPEELKALAAVLFR